MSAWQTVWHEFICTTHEHVFPKDGQVATLLLRGEGCGVPPFQSVSRGLGSNKVIRTLVPILLGLLLACGGPPSSTIAPADASTTQPSSEVAVVANSEDGTLSVLSVESGRVLGTVDAIADGPRASFFEDPVQWMLQPYAERQGGLNYAQDTDLSVDGTVVFVSRGFRGDVVAIDLASGEILWRTPISGLRSDHMDISPDGRRLYVSGIIRSDDVVEVLDSVSGERIGRIAAGRWPHDVHVSSDGQRVYIASLGDMEKSFPERVTDPLSHTVTVADADTFVVLERHSFETGVRPFAVTSDQSRLYAQLSNLHVVESRRVSGNAAARRLELPIAHGVTEADWDFEAPHHGLALSPDERTLCIAGRASDYAALVAVPDLEVVATIPTGDAPSWSAFASGGDLCLLANNRSNDVSFIDVARRVEVRRVAVGEAPKHITIGRVPDSVLAEMQGR